MISGAQVQKVVRACMIRLLNLEPCLILQCHLYHLYNFILLKFTAVKCQMILGNIFPFLICKVLIISTPFFIHFLNQLLCTFFFPSRTLDDSLYTILKWCMDKYAQAFYCRGCDWRIGQRSHNLLSQQHPE